MQQHEETETASTDAGIIWLTDDEAYEMFDRRTQELLGMSGEEFLRRWDAGEYRSIEDDPGHYEVMELSGLISFARKDSSGG